MALAIEKTGRKAVARGAPVGDRRAVIQRSGGGGIFAPVPAGGVQGREQKRGWFMLRLANGHDDGRLPMGRRDPLQKRRQALEGVFRQAVQTRVVHPKPAGTRPCWVHGSLTLVLIP